MAKKQPMYGSEASVDNDAIADAVVAHSITDAATELSAANEAELEGFLDALGGKINAIIAALENFGIIKT